MVRNSDLSYGEVRLKARNMTDHQEIGETMPPVLKQFKAIIDDAIQKQYDAGISGKFYVHLFVRKEDDIANSLHIFAQNRITRPSPYQQEDHYLWSVYNGEAKFEWCIPSKEILGYILANPYEFDPSYVRMLQNFCSDKIERIEDYFVNGKVM